MQGFAPSPTPVPKFFHNLLGSGGWTETDGSDIVDTVTDHSGYTDVLTKSNTGRAYWTLPLEDFLGGPVSAGTEVVQIGALCKLVTATYGFGTNDGVFVGVSDNANPTAGGALWETVGLEQESTNISLRGFWNGGNAAGSALDMDRCMSPIMIFRGNSDFITYGYGFKGSAFVSFRNAGAGRRVITPTHLLVMLAQNNASAKTIRIETGFGVQPPLPGLTIAAGL